MQKRSGLKKKLELKMKYDFTTKYIQLGDKATTTCTVTTEEIIDLLNHFSSNFLSECTDFLNTGVFKDEETEEEVTSLFEIWIAMARQVIDVCYPIISASIELKDVVSGDTEKTWEAAKAFMQFLHFMFNLEFFKDNGDVMEYALVDDSTRTDLSNYKELTITQAEELIRKKLRMNVVILSDI